MHTWFGLSLGIGSPEQMMAFLLCPKCRPCDIKCAPNAPVASTSSPAPSANPDVIHSASNDPTVYEAVALSRVAKGTAVDAALSFRNWRLEEKYAKKGNLCLTHYLFTSLPPPPV